MPNPTVVNSVSAAGTAVSITTASIASTSGNFIGVGVGNFVRDVGPTDVSDSKVNPWLVAFRQTGTGRSLVGLFYQPNIIGGAGHTFTNTPTGGSDVTTIGVIEFSGMPTNDSLDVTANRSVGVNIGGVTELNRSGATAFTNRPNSLLLGVATAPTTAPISKELFVDDISLANGAVEDVLFSWFITISAGTYNFKTSPANATQCAIASFKGTNIRVLQNKTAQAGGGSSSVTTAAITTTSGNFLAAGCTDFTQAISGTRISDSKTNTWQTARIETRIAMYYSENIIGGSGHTFTFTPNVADFLGLGIYEISGNAKSSSLDAVNSGAAGDSGNITTAQSEELLLGLNTSGSGAIQSSSAFTSLWTDQIAQAGSQTLTMSYRIVSKRGQYQYGVQSGSNNPEGAGIAAFKLPGGPNTGGSTPPAPPIGSVAVLSGNVIYATPARAINIEYLTTGAAILEGSLDAVIWIVLDTAPGAGLRTINGVVAPFIRPSVDITVVFRKTKAKM